ncbi:MAG: MMPL family transporter [Myxococcota bacterium]
MTWLARRSLDRPHLTALLCGVLTVVLGLGALRLELRTDGAALTPEHHPVVLQDADDRARFRDPRTLLLLAHARTAEHPLASPEGLRFLRDVDARLRRLGPLRSSGLLSIASLPRIERERGAVSIGAYVDRIPDEPAAFAVLLAEARSHPLADGLLLARDGQSALFILPLSESAAVREAVVTLQAFARRAGNARFELVLGGPLLAETTLGDQVLRDLAVLVPLMLAVVVVLLYAMLGSVGGVLVPLIETGVVLAMTFGAMGWAGAPIALVSTILPVVLMAMCITDEIHLLERMAAHAEGAGLRARVEASLREVGRPIVLTSLTTAAGFLSFTSTSIEPLRQFGLFAAFGILVAMGLTFSLIPALIVLLPAPLFEARRRRAGRGWQTTFGAFAARRPGVCFAIGAVALALVLPGTARLRVSDSWVENFDPDAELVRAERLINDAFWGSYRLDVVLEAPAGFFRDPLGVGIVERVGEAVRSGPRVGGVETYLDTLTELAEVLDTQPPLSALPPDRLWDLFTLAELSEGGAGLGWLMSADDEAVRVRLYVRSPDYAAARALTQHLDGALPALVGAGGVRFHYSGELPVATALVESIVRNQLRSIGWAIVTVALLLLVFERRARALLAVIPVATATAGLLGVMGYSGATLGIATSMFASLAVGVGVDFGIHFLHRFERERALGRDYAAAIRATFEQAGNALFWNALVLSAGFSVLVASSLKPNHSLGLLLTSAVLACFACTFLLLPLLLRASCRRAVGTALAAAGVAALLAASPVRAGAPDCGGPPDQNATALMTRLERVRRGTPRILRMNIETIYPEHSRLARVPTAPTPPKSLWGLVDGDVDETWLLYVFTGPGRMAGTSLLIQDFSDSTERDTTWFYLRAYENFSRLSGRIERAMVPGSALSYEDARGYITGDKYLYHARIATGTAPDAATAGSATPVTRVVACPRTRALASRLGYASLTIDVDPERLIVERIEYRALGGEPLKLYRLVESVDVDGHAYPARVHLEHVVDGFENDVTYEYWSVPEGLPRELFWTDVSEGAFLGRLRTLLEERGLGDRIDAEIAAAEARIRIYDERMRALESQRQSGESPEGETTDRRLQ